MITKQQFRDALLIVEKYCNQIKKTPAIILQTCDVGCRVKLSKYGLIAQGNRKSKLIGTVVDYYPWIFNPKTDGLVTVKWDSIKIPDSMHISQIEKVAP